MEDRMSEDISYTTDEIAKLLKISKLTVYDLIKKNELPAYRVGRQMRVDAKDLEQYKTNAKSGSYSSPSNHAAKSSPLASAQKSIVITGQDASLDILSTYMEKKIQGMRPLRSYVGSLDSLIAMYQGEADLVSCHLLDGDTGIYNLPYIRKILVSQPIIVIGLAARSAGFYVQKGNPIGFKKWEDLGIPNLRIANREKGSGARVLLDEQLRIHGISPDSLKGYEQEEQSHLAVAGKVASGEADIGVGIEKTAYWVGVDFIPLIQEKLDLVMLNTAANASWIAQVVDILQSDAFKNELRSIGGYDLSHTGHLQFKG
jgi:putative molybdopterin biosynthesis protein